MGGGEGARSELCSSLCTHGNCQYCVCGVTGGVDSSGGVEPGQSSVSHSVSMVTVSTVFVV